MKKTSYLFILIFLIFSSLIFIGCVPDDDYDDDRNNNLESSYTVPIGKYLVIYNNEQAKANNEYIQAFYAQEGTSVTYTLNSDGKLINATWWIRNEVYERVSYINNPKSYKVSSSIF